MPLIDRREFVGLEGVTHLCTGGEAPWRIWDDRRPKTTNDAANDVGSAACAS